MAVQTEGAPILEWDDWQLNAVDVAVKRKKVGLFAEMGLGKTPVACEFIDRVNPSSCLIVVPKKALIGWRRRLKDWWPHLYDKFVQIYSKNKTLRAQQWASNPAFVITTIDWFRRDKGMRSSYQMEIYDETHKYLRNRKTKTFEQICARKMEYLMLISGSPSSSDSFQFWPSLHLINPKLFSSYWRFVKTFCTEVETMWGREIVGPKNIDSLQAVLRQHFIIVRKKDLAAQAGKKTKKRRIFLDVEMTEPQRAAYEQMRDDLMLELSNGTIMAVQHDMGASLRMRQLLVCPYILDPGLGIGGGLTSILEELQEMPEEDRHCIIFTPFRDAVDVIADQLIAWNVTQHVGKLMGGIDVDEQEAILERLKKNRGIAVSTILYGESWDYELADKAFFLGYEPKPISNWQAEDRVDRRNNTNELLRMFYVRNIGTYEEDIIDKLIVQGLHLEAMYNDPTRIKQILRKRTVE